jgi:hypothetical protein
MRPIIFLLLFLVGTNAIAQKISNKEVPAAVKSAFQKLYPSVSKAKWSKEGANFEAEFDQKEETSVVIDSSGNILETEVEIQKEQLPKEVFAYVNSNFAGKSIKEAAKITDAKGVITYEAEIKGMELLFDANGKFISGKKE